MEKNRIDIGNGYSLVVTVNRSDSPKDYPDEIYVTIENEQLCQDVCIVRQAYIPGTGERLEDKVECLVFSDASDEDYTHKFQIDALKPF